MKDLFSRHASAYANYRPAYPKELFELLLDQVRERGSCWDVATGNGQVARDLASSFDRVYATDISEEQLAQAPSVPNVYYRTSPAEHSPFSEGLFDLIVVAQALHWFDVRAFHKEAQRVGKEGALIAEWGYRRLESEDGDIDRLLRSFYEEKIGPYWDPERVHIDREYEDLPFPFKDVTRERFQIRVEWDAERTAAYLRTWSSVQRYIEEEGEDPTLEVLHSLQEERGDEKIRFFFPLFLRWGRV